MKTNILLLAALMMVSTLFAQDSSYKVGYAVTSEMAKKANGTIVTENDSEGFYSFVIEYPNNYSFESIRLDFSSFFNEFEDVKIVVLWKKDKEGKYIAQVDLPNTTISIFFIYNPKNSKYLFISTNKT